VTSARAINRRATGKRLKLSPAKYRELCQYVFERDGFCLFCGNPNNLTPAHVIARSQGGSDSPNNIVAACVVRADGSKGCHKRFDDYEIDLPESAQTMLLHEPDRL
jgi:5-methylcytosine-specific restriction endonuclease McrA